jgi:hypothetical protein
LAGWNPPSTPSRQGTGNKRRDKTVSEQDIPKDNLATAEIKEGPTEGALPPASAEPNLHGLKGPPVERRGKLHD